MWWPHLKHNKAVTEGHLQSGIGVFLHTWISAVEWIFRWEHRKLLDWSTKDPQDMRLLPTYCLSSAELLLTSQMNKVQERLKAVKDQRNILASVTEIRLRISSLSPLLSSPLQAAGTFHLDWTVKWNGKSVRPQPSAAYVSIEWREITGLRPELRINFS